MKTTLNIQDTLLVEVKALAARQRTTLTRLVEEGLRMRLRATESLPTQTGRKPMPAFHGKGGLATGLSGLSTREIQDRLDALGDLPSNRQFDGCQTNQ